jgi:putative N6-adenine-specific DNA methylase
VSCPKRFSALLADEIRALGYTVTAEWITGVRLAGSLADTMKLNLHLRTATRVLFLLKEFKAQTADELYAALAEIPWEDYIDENGYMSVVSSVDTYAIRDSMFANVRVKDAIVDRLRERTGKRPDSGAERTGAVVFLYWKDETCAIYLDTSGEPLSKRGYRKIPWKAPLQETLAAAIILSTGWKGEGNLVNPMCGSGTLGIEAILIALGRAPGISRTNFAFEHLKGFDEPAWKALRKEARDAAARTLEGKVILSDIHEHAIFAARKNATTAGVDHLIEFVTGDFSETPIPEGGGIVVLNPEYGERLGDERKLESTYAAIGDFFKQKCSGYRGYIFTGNPVLAKRIGLRTSRKIPFFNATIDCRLLEYELYAGTKKRRDGETAGLRDGETEREEPSTDGGQAS